MNREYSLTPEEITVYRLAHEFSARQKVVFKAMIELRPDVMVRWGAIAEDQLPSPLKPLTKSSTIFRGYWGEHKEWQYELHGLGCRLIHTLTREQIEWDAPHLQRFNPHWFTDWIKWKLDHTANDSYLDIVTTNSEAKELKITVFEILDRLTKKQMLRFYPETTSMYGLIE